jgi:hypothetical protein
MVKNVIWLNDLPFSELFGGFYSVTLNQAEQLWALNGKQIGDNNASVSLEKYNELKAELEKMALTEALGFVDEYINENSSENLSGEYIEEEDFELNPSSNVEEELGSLILDPSLFATTSKTKK